MANTIRIDPKTHAKLKRIAKRSGMQMHIMASLVLDSWTKGRSFVPAKCTAMQQSEDVTV